MNLLFCLLSFTFVLFASAGPLPPGDYRVECGQGSKVFTILKFEEEGHLVLAPKCTKVEPAKCTKGCEWAETCDLHSAFEDNTVYVAGMVSTPTGLVEAYCCESLGLTLNGCMWKKPIISLWPTAIVEENQVVQNIRGGFVEDLEFEVCNIASRSISCSNPESKKSATTESTDSTGSTEFATTESETTTSA